MWRDAFGTKCTSDEYEMKKGIYEYFLSLCLLLFALATKHRRILIRFLSILQSYHLNFTLEKYSEHVIFSIIFLNVPCAYLLYSFPTTIVDVVFLVLLKQKRVRGKKGKAEKESE